MNRDEFSAFLRARVSKCTVAAEPPPGPVAYYDRFGHRREVCSTRNTSTTPAVTRYATM